MLTTLGGRFRAVSITPMETLIGYMQALNSSYYTLGPCYEAEKAQLAPKVSLEHALSRFDAACLPS